MRRWLVSLRPGPARSAPHLLPCCAPPPSPSARPLAPCQGGATAFHHPSLRGLAVQPQQGSALVFYPAFIDGELDDRMAHSGQARRGCCYRLALLRPL